MSSRSTAQIAVTTASHADKQLSGKSAARDAIAKSNDPRSERGPLPKTQS